MHVTDEQVMIMTSRGRPPVIADFTLPTHDLFLLTYLPTYYGAHPRRLIHPAPPVFECRSVCLWVSGTSLAGGGALLISRPYPPHRR